MRAALRLLTNPAVVRVIEATTWFSAGGALSYVVTKKRLEAKYVEIAENEIDEAREFFRNTYKTDELSDPMKLAEELYGIHIEEVPEREVTDADKVAIQAMISEYYAAKDTVAEEIREEINAATDELEQRVETIFDKAVDGNVGKEVPHAKVEPPHVISNTVYFENEPDHHQVDLVYYEGDEVLCDARDRPVDEKLIGTANLEMFGTRSKDPNIVYIRNNELKTDYCVNRDGRSYADHVAGIEHSVPLRRMRGDD